MGILNHTSDGLYNMVAVLYRTLAHLGPMPSETLLACCTGGIDPGNGPKMRHALNRWTELGLFNEESEQVSIAPGYESPADADDLALTEGVRRAALRVVFESKNISNIWSTDGSADFARGIAWWMAQDAWNADTGTAALLRLETSQLVRGDLRIVSNDVRMTRLREWARFLGFGWITPLGGVELDPTAAIDRVLDQVLPQADEQMAAADFLLRLAELLPVLDQGRCRVAIEAQLKNDVWTPTPPGWVSTTLGRALRQLKHIGRLSLYPRPDAGSAVRIPGREGTRGRPWGNFTHVARSGAIG